MLGELNAKQLQEALRGTCSPISFAGLNDARAGSRGTITWIALANRVYGVTNEHLVEGFFQPGDTGRLRLGLHPSFSISAKLLFSSRKRNPDFPFDLALFSLDREETARLEISPLTLDAKETLPTPGSSMLAAGHPASLGGTENELVCLEMECLASSDRVMIFKTRPPAGRELMNPAGMSGAPVFSPDLEDRHALCGIVYQGRGPLDAAARRAEGELWLWAFPFGLETMERVLSACGEERT